MRRKDKPHCTYIVIVKNSEPNFFRFPEDERKNDLIIRTKIDFGMCNILTCQIVMILTVVIITFGYPQKLAMDRTNHTSKESNALMNC